MVAGPGVLIGRKGSLGTVFYIAGEYWPHDTTLWVKDFHGNNPRFVYYFFKTLDTLSMNVGAANPTLNRNHVHPIEIVWPPRGEQDGIAEVLGALDDKIELNRHLSQTLEEMAQTLFRSWFVDFVPVQAKAEGRQPEGVDAQTAALFPSKLVESELGLIPEGWVVVSLTEAVDVNPSRMLSKSSVAPYLDMANMPTSSARALDVTRRPFGSGMRFINGDTLVARITPCLENGKTAFVDFLAEGEVGWGSTEFIVLRPRPPLPPEYGYFLARTPEFRSFAITNMTGTSGRQRVPADCFGGFKVVLPHSTLASKFGDIALQMFAAMKAHDEESRTLAEIRDILLPKLLSGEIRVREAEAQLAVGA
jgi:type I restriction enzyme, S subunit